MKPVLMLAVAGAVLTGCTAAQRNYSPVVDFRASQGYGTNYQKDLFECQQLALQRSPAENAAQDAVAGAIGGAILGGIIGSFDGNFGKGAGYGAAIGGAGGALHGAAEGTRAQETIVINCLRARGYAVVGR